MEGWYERPEDQGLTIGPNIVGMERLILDVICCGLAVDDLTFDEYFDERGLAWR